MAISGEVPQDQPHYQRHSAAETLTRSRERRKRVMAIDRSTFNNRSDNLQLNWMISAEISRITGTRVQSCRKAASRFLKAGYEISKLQGPDGFKIANASLRGTLKSQKAKGESKLPVTVTYSLNFPSPADTPDSSVLDSSVQEPTRYPFDSDLVETLGKLSKKHGYYNVHDALKLYQELSQSVGS